MLEISTSIAYFCHMRKIAGRNILDYGIVSICIFLAFSVFQPFGMDGLEENPINFWYLFLETGLIFISQVVAEIITVYVFGFPSDYSKDIPYQRKRLLCFFLVLLPLVSLILEGFWNVVLHGWNHIGYMWTDDEGSFTLRNWLYQLVEDACVCVLVYGYTWMLTTKRMKEYQLQQLASINSMLENAAEAQNTEEERPSENICIHGDSKESLELCPNDILFVESVANYVDIWYFDKEEVCQKRLRSTLKAIEETLSSFEFMVHCHRAFLVNINFITHVEGNAAGCQVQLFGLQKSLPVSKANIELLRTALARRDGSSLKPSR